MTEGRLLRRAAIAAVIAWAAVLGADPSASAAPDKPAADAAALRQKEEAARADAAAEVEKLAAFDASKSAWDDARRDLAKALTFSPGDASLKDELGKLRGRVGKPAKEDAPAVAQRRVEALAKCAECLAPAAEAYAQAERTDELGALLALMKAQDVPLDALVAKLGLVFYEPYLDWRTKAVAAKFDAGWDYVDGEWLDPKKAAARDAEHATWKNPWELSDDVHVLHTNLPRHVAKQVMAHVAAYRRFFLDYFAGEWDFATPTKKLPLIVTRTRAELDERTEAMGFSRAPVGMAAFYMATSGVGNPCFISLEIGVYGEQSKVNFAGLQQVFEHELGHQIAYEFSKHLSVRGRWTTGQYCWAIEGLAEFMPSHVLVDGAWKLKARHWVPATDEAHSASPLGWCHDHVDELPRLSEFLATPYQSFLNSRCYRMAASLSWFLLEGKDRAYRSRYIDLLQTVHSERATPKTVEEMFPGDAVYDVDMEFREFLREVEFDDD